MEEPRYRMYLQLIQVRLKLSSMPLVSGGPWTEALCWVDF